MVPTSPDNRGSTVIIYVQNFQTNSRQFGFILPHGVNTLRLQESDWSKRLSSYLYFVALFGSCVVYEPLDRYVGRHLDRHIGRLSVDISTDARPICRSTYRPTLGRCVDRDVSVDMSTDISADISTDMSVAMLTDTSRSTHRPSVGRHVDR